MATRRHDPGRRDRIIAAATELISEDGVAGASHRRIASRAGVPLGSMSYHFAGMDEILAEVFTRFTAAISAGFERRLDDSPDRAAAIEAIVDVIHDDVLATRRGIVLALELYALAARRPEFRRITRAWTTRSRTALESHVDPATARQLDALIEGLIIQGALGVEGPPVGADARSLTRDAAARVLAGT